MYFSRFPDATLTEADVKELLDERAADIVNSIPHGRRRHPVIYWEDEGGLQVDELASHFFADGCFHVKDSTMRAKASAIVGHLNFLAGRKPVQINTRTRPTRWETLPPPYHNQIPTTYLLCERDDFHRWIGFLEYGKGLRTTSQDTVISHVKTFYEWLFEQRRITDVPWRKKMKKTADGYEVEGIAMRKSVKSDTIERKPFLPHQMLALQQVLAEQSDAGEVRDPALVRFYTATGCRAEEALGLTRFELPPPDTSGNFFVPFTVPGAITKSDTTRHLDAAEVGLDAARNYRDGDRQFVISQRKKPYEPPNGQSPLLVDETRTNHIEAVYEDPTDPAKQVKGSWALIPEDLRLRFVDADGQSVMLWLERRGTPLSYDRYYELFKEAVETVAAADPTVTTKTHVPHSTRHTFAVWKANILWRTGRFGSDRSAVETVSEDLGHVSKDTTIRSYLRCVNDLTSTPVPDIYGAF